MDEKMFPILDWRGKYKRLGCPAAVPWDLVKMHEMQCIKNHMQSVLRLAVRGGLCPEELMAILEDRPWYPMDTQEAIDHLNKILETYTAKSN